MRSELQAALSAPEVPPGQLGRQQHGRIRQVLQQEACNGQGHARYGQPSCQQSIAQLFIPATRQGSTTLSAWREKKGYKARRGQKDQLGM